MSLNMTPRVLQEFDRIVRETAYATRVIIMAAGNAGPVPTQTVNRTYRVTTSSDGAARAITVAVTVTELTGAAVASATPAVTDDVTSR